MHWYDWVLLVVAAYLLVGVIFDIWFCIQKDENYKVNIPDLLAGLVGWPIALLVRAAIKSGGGWI